jgi:superfamily II DNA or RNA helicase
MNAITLRPYQHDAIEAIRTAFQERGVNRPLIVVPTGGGKTVIFSRLIKRRSESGRALVIAHREELLDQAIAKLHRDAPHLTVGKVKAKHNQHEDVDVVVASIQTLAQEHRIAPLIGTIQTVIIDEAHHAASKSYLTTMERLGCFEPDGPLTVGVTATAGRADGVGLWSAWQEIVYRRGILQMITDGFLVDVRALVIQADIDYGDVRVRRGDFVESDLAIAIEGSEAIEAAAQAYAKEAKDRCGVAFTPSIASSQALAERLNELGIRAEHLSGQTPSAERRAILTRLSSGETQVVTNAAVLTEGFDEPRVSCVLVVRPTKSETLFTQMVGRGLRLREGKTDCLVLTLAGPPGGGLATLADLSGKAPGEVEVAPKEGQSLTEAAEEEAERRADPRVLGRMTVRQINLFRTSRIRWTPIQRALALVGTNDTLFILPDRAQDMWQLIQVPSSGDPRLVGQHLTLERAKLLGEELLDPAAKKLLKSHAPWRSGQPSEKQVAFLRRIGQPSEVTKGEASDLLNAHKAARLLDRLATSGALTALYREGVAA